MEPGVKHYMLNNKEEVNKLPIRPGQLITSRENQILLDMDDGRRHPLGVQMGTQDLIDGESDLATGVLYVVMGEGGGSAGGGGAAAPTIKVDSELSDTSTNPVQNKVITSEIDYIYYKLDKLESVEVDTSLSESSKNPVQNRVITSEINNIYDKIDNLKAIDVDSELSESSVNPVQNRVITKKLNEVFQSVSDGKALVASAITDKGVDTNADATFSQLADNISQIESGSGYAYVEDNLQLWLTNHDGILCDGTNAMNLGQVIKDNNCHFTVQVVFLLGDGNSDKCNIICKSPDLLGGFALLVGKKAFEDADNLFFPVMIIGNSSNTNIGTYLDMPINQIIESTLAFDGNYLKSYINGNLVCKIQCNGDISQSSAIEIGKSISPFYQFIGNLMDLKVYDVALTDSDISQNLSENVERFGISKNVFENESSNLKCEWLYARSNIDTEIIPTEKTWIEVCIKAHGLTGYTLIGYYNDSSDSWRLFNHNHRIYFDYGNDTSYRMYGDGFPLNEYIEFTLKNGEVWKNGEKVLSGSVNPSFNGSQSIKINAETATSQIKYLRIYEGEEMIANYIPILSNGLYGLYDKISQKSFLSDGNYGKLIYKG